jgi:hypothetical protein
MYVSKPNPKKTHNSADRGTELERASNLRKPQTLTKPKRSPLVHEVEDGEDELMVEEFPLTTTMVQ